MITADEGANRPMYAQVNRLPVPVAGHSTVSTTSDSVSQISLMSGVFPLRETPGKANVVRRADSKDRSKSTVVARRQLKFL